MKMPGRSLLTICWKVKLMNQFRIAPAISTINSMKCAKSSKTPSKLVCFLKILMKVNNKWQICRSQWIKIRPICKQWGIGEEKKWTISLSSESWVRMLTRRASLLVKKCILNKSTNPSSRLVSLNILRRKVLGLSLSWMVKVNNLSNTNFRELTVSCSPVATTRRPISVKPASMFSITPKKKTTEAISSQCGAYRSAFWNWYSILSILQTSRLLNCWMVRIAWPPSATSNWYSPVRTPIAIFSDPWRAKLAVLHWENMFTTISKLDCFSNRIGLIINWAVFGMWPVCSMIRMGRS